MYAWQGEWQRIMWTREPRKMTSRLYWEVVAARIWNWGEDWKSVAHMFEWCARILNLGWVSVADKENIMGLPRQVKDGDWTAGTTVTGQADRSSSWMMQSKGILTAAKLQSEQNYCPSFTSIAVIKKNPLDESQPERERTLFGLQSQVKTTCHCGKVRKGTWNSLSELQ